MFSPSTHMARDGLASTNENERKPAKHATQTEANWRTERYGTWQCRRRRDPTQICIDKSTENKWHALKLMREIEKKVICLTGY